MRRTTLAATISALAMSQSGCIVAGYSPGRGGFLWPGGGLGLLLLIALLYFLFGRGRR